MEIAKVSIAKIGLASAEPTLDDFRDIGERLKEAFSKIGFVYLCDHGIDDDVISSAMKASKEFFSLPQDIKDASLKVPPLEQGYVKPGQEIFDAKEDWKEATMEYRESFDISHLSGSCAIFPDENVAEFRPVMIKLAKMTKELAFRFLKSLGLSLGLAPDFFAKTHDQIFNGRNATKMRTLFYPPLNDDQIREDVVSCGVMRCGAHSDYGTVTFLYQDDLGGLEVKDVGKSWIDAKPIPGTILVNMGDLTEMLSNGLYPATRHRVMVPEAEMKRKTCRQSIVLFVHPNNDVLIEPLPGLNGPPKYEPVTAYQHLMNRFSATYR